MPGLTIRKVADMSAARQVKYDPDTGERYLADPATGQPSPRPLVGINLEDAPDKVRVSTNIISGGVAEGWAELVNPTPVVRPAGRTMAEWNSSQTGTPHTFIHADAIIFHTLDGDVTYKVAHQPDKYVDPDAASHPDRVTKFKRGDKVKVTPEIYEAGATRVDHFYDLVKES